MILTRLQNGVEKLAPRDPTAHNYKVIYAYRCEQGHNSERECKLADYVDRISCPQCGKSARRNYAGQRIKAWGGETGAGRGRNHPANGAPGMR